MREKMYSMVQILVERCLQDRRVLENEREMVSLLTNRGFLQEEIYDVLSWIQQFGYDMRGGESKLSGRRTRAVRVMHPEERLAFTPAAQGLLHRLYSSGSIDDHLREEIIQRCIDLVDEEIGLEEVKTTTLLVMFKENRDTPGEKVFQIVEENETRLMN